MNNAKRIVAATLSMIMLVALMVMLGACSAAGDTQGGRGFDSTRSSTHFNTSVYSAETADTVYFAGWLDYYIKYVDKETGVSGVLCGKPECTHDGKTCNAYMGASPRALLVENDRLYWVSDTISSLNVGCEVYSLALDGSDRRLEAQLERDYIPKGAGYRTYVLADGYVYFGGTADDIEDSVQVYTDYVLAFPLGGGEEPRVILNERIERSQYSGIPMQAYGGCLYFITNALDGTVEQAEETGAYLYNYKLRRYSVETGELDTLFEIDRADINRMTELWVMDDGVLLCGYDAAYENIGVFKYYFESGEFSVIYEVPEIFEHEALTNHSKSIMDDLVTSYGMMNNEGVYSFDVVIKDFEGNLLVDDTYVLDLREEYAYYGTGSVYALGRDEENIYYAFTAPFYEPGHPDNGWYTTVIAVPLDGSGAEVLCTQVEYRK